MTEDLHIRPTLPRDSGAIATLYRATFPGEDLLALVRELMADSQHVLSLAAVRDDELIGHVAITLCTVGASLARVALLGPLAVAPPAQKRGTGCALVRDGLARLAREDVMRVLVLGAPTYYARFGFSVETEILPPYPLPEHWGAAWQSVSLGGDQGGQAAPCRGRLNVPQPWRRPSLWAP